MTINSSPGLAFSQLQYSRSYDRLNKDYSHLSSGLKLEKSADGPSDYSLSNNLRADTKMLRMARQNAFDGFSFIQVTDSILDEAVNLLTRATELATHAASGTTTANEKMALDTEYQQILAELDRMDLQSEYNDIPIFGSSFVVQFGDASDEAITVTTPPVDTTSFSLNATDLTSDANAESVLQLTSDALQTLSAQRSLIGSKSNRLRNTLELIDQRILETTSQESKMRDADIAFEVTQMTTHQLQQEGAKAALSQGGLSAGRVLTLLA